MKEKNDFWVKYIHIPIEVFANNKLDKNDLIIFALIDMMDGEKHCWASNQYFADITNISKVSVSTSISKLEEQKYIFRKLMNDNKRILSINPKFKELHFQYSKEINSKIIENSSLNKVKYPIKEKLNSSLNKVKDNNIYNSNILSKDNIRPSDEGQDHFLIKRRNTSLKNISLIDKKDKTIISYSPTKESLEIYSYWKGKGLKAYEEKYKGYVNDLQAIKKLLNGKCFNNNEFTQYKNHKFTNKEITLSIGRFALFALNSDYLPRDKKVWPKKTFKEFIYNSYQNIEGYGRSMFIYCLENNMKFIKEKDIEVEDKYPIVTKAIKKKYTQVIMGSDSFEYSNIQENDFRKAAIFAQEFFKKNQGRLIGSYQELKPYKIAECLIDALMKSNPDMMRVQPYWLFNNIMQQKLPAYLYSTAIMKEENSSSNSQENTFYNFGKPLE